MSSSSGKTNLGKIKGMFETVHVKNQNVGELDRYFVANFFHELRNQWHFIDDDGIQHDVNFNMSATQPLLTNGWGLLRTYYQWSGNKQISFLYCGNNSFMMKPNQDYIPTSFFPNWHSFSPFNPNNPFFSVRIYDTGVNTTELYLPQHFASFLMQKNHSEVKLSGPLNNVVDCKVLISNQTFGNVKFGEGWSTFCVLNNIAQGNHLKFEYDGLMDHNNVLIVTQM